MFELDARLQSSAFFLSEWPLSIILLKNERTFPWFILIPKKEDIKELFQLKQEDQMLLMKEIHHLSLIIRDYFQPQKLNIASLGNIVSQLHIHCIGRREEDPYWPQGVWQSSYIAQPYDEAEVDALLPEIKHRLGTVAWS